SEFGGPIVASFRIFAGTASIRAALMGGISSGNTSLGSRWAVQGTPLKVTGVTVAPSSVAFTDSTPMQLTATAALSGTTGTAASCTAPSMRDVSLLTTWASNAESVADVSFFGLVTPVASGDANVHWRYAGTVPPIQGNVPITVP